MSSGNNFNSTSLSVEEEEKVSEECATTTTTSEDVVIPWKLTCYHNGASGKSVRTDKEKGEALVLKLLWMFSVFCLVYFDTLTIINKMTY